MKEKQLAIFGKIPSVPVIVCTGKPEICGTNVIFKQGIVEYLTKPIAQGK